MTTDFSQRPYYDDFDAAKNFLKVLFRSERSVQIRELNQVQTILQNQVSSLGDHLFKDGSRIENATTNLSVEEEYATVTLDSGYDSIKSYLGTDIKVVGASLVEATLVDAVDTDGVDPVTLYIRYKSGTETDTIFPDGDQIELRLEDETIIETGSVIETGRGSAVSITEGRYYVKGYAVEVAKQRCYLDKYGVVPTGVIGFTIKENIITEFDDATLYDNANDTLNSNAPGAHRFKIELVLTFNTDLNYTEDDFIPLITVESGSIQTEARSTSYDELADTLAVRTYEESGDYAVDNFDVALREHLKTDDNDGVLATEDGGDSSKYVVELDPGTAYVKGYRVQTVSPKQIAADKARDTQYENNTVTNVGLGAFIRVQNLHSLPDIDTFDTVSFRDAATATPGVAAGNQVGTARVRSVGFDGTNYKLYLFDINMNTGKAFSSDVKSVYQSGAAPMTADLVLYDSVAYLEGNSAIGLHRLPYENVQTIRSSDASIDTSYIIKKRFTATADANGIVTLAAGANEIFEGYTPDNYVLSDDSSGDVVDLTGKVTLSGTPTGKSLVIDLTATYSNKDVTVIGTLTKTAAQEKSKILNTVILSSVSPASEISLTRADVYSVQVIDEVTSDDITEKYILDNGQRDTYYGIGKIKLSPAESVPTNNLTIRVDYFVHGAGDYFSVDSYSGAVNYEDIPAYVSNSGDIYELKDCIDTRPTKAEDGTFTSSGADRVNVIKDQTSVRADMSFYLNRIDVVYVDKFGTFGVKKGLSAVVPVKPKAPNNSMSLYELFVPAYTGDVDKILVNVIDNKRYTMRDIGKLERRLENVEYYTSLNLLEQQTKNMTIQDDSGFERFKNGFVVDNFESYDLGDTSNDEFRASVDITEGECRPSFDMDMAQLDLDDSTNVQVHENTITLPYTEKVLYRQRYASTTMNINPFAVFKWIGTGKISPSRDSWISSRRAPAVVIQKTNQDIIKKTVWEKTLKKTNTEVTNKTVNRDNSVNVTINRRPWFRTRWNAWNRNLFGSPEPRVLAEPSTSVSSNTTSVIASRNVSSEIKTLGVSKSSRTSSTNKVVDDRVVDRSIIPYARTRDIRFEFENLIQNSRVYPFFDGVDVSAYCKQDGKSYGSNLVTDVDGKITGVFTLPEGKDTIRKLGLSSGTKPLSFRTGNRLFRITSDKDNDQSKELAFAEAMYTSRGVLETKQQTVLSTRNVVTTVVETKQRVDTTTLNKVNTTTVTRTTTRPVFRAQDPLAQSFLVKNAGGNFITGIRVFFETKDNNVPVKLQLRLMENGMPTQTVVPFGEVVLKPNQVSTSSDSSAGTLFKFSDPVYLSDEFEYCFVLMANSVKYNVYVAELGGVDMLTKNPIAKQPHTGVLFQSQNNSTWTELQTHDMKFDINYAEFVKDTARTVTFKNEPNRKELLEHNPIETVSGDSKVFVHFGGHGFFPGDLIEISGAVGGNGIGTVNGLFSVTAVHPDWVQVEMGTNATSSGLIGGDAVIASQNHQYNVGVLNLEQIVLPRTDASWALKTTSGKSESGTETPHVLDATYTPVEVRKDINFSTPRVISSEDNLEDSLVAQCTLYTEADNLSPVIDLETMSFACIANRINDPDVSDIDYEAEETYGSARAKYVTRPVKLAQPAKSIKVYFAGNIPQGAYLDVYYKTSNQGAEEAFNGVDYVQMASVEYPAQTDEYNKFSDFEFEVDDIADFDVFSVKVVMRSNNSSNVPRIKDFRAIALGT